MRELTRLAVRVAELERRLAQTVRHGTVHQVDAAQGLVRLKLGEGDAGIVLSPWIRYAQIGGALRVHSPPSVGQQMSVMAPGGDLVQAVAMPLGFSDAIPSPSGAAGSHIATIGAVAITATATGLTVTVGGVTLAVSAAGVAITGGTVTHDGKDIGKTHRHSDVAIGVNPTGPPI